jgi:hypothetical protein
MDIAIDFDGTCVTHEYPEVGKEIGATEVLRELVAKGHNLILFTMRSDFNGYDDDGQQIPSNKCLTDAVNWFRERNIPLHGIQKNPSQLSWTSSPKAYAELYIDDSALGCPLIYERKISDRPFVDWKRVREYLDFMGIL